MALIRPNPESPHARIYGAIILAVIVLGVIAHYVWG
jgi:hypothetical protein